MKSPYAVTKQLEDMLCEYTGAPFAVAVNSASEAIGLCCEYFGAFDKSFPITLPANTYVSVPAQVKRAGFSICFDYYRWRGYYQLKPLPVWDCARRFTSGMYVAGQYQCVSFATTKILGIEQGGAILHDNVGADAWFRRMRFDGRAEGVDPKDDRFTLCGRHCIMLPSIAAQLVLKLHHLPRHNEDMPDYPYPDLSQHPAFK